MWHPLVKYIMWESYNELLSQIEPFFQRLLDTHNDSSLLSPKFYWGRYPKCTVDWRKDAPLRSNDHDLIWRTSFFFFRSFCVSSSTLEKCFNQFSAAASELRRKSITSIAVGNEWAWQLKSGWRWISNGTIYQIQIPKGLITLWREKAVL